MSPPQGIIKALRAEFPRPTVDSEWLEQCCTWIAEEKGLSSDKNLQEFLKIVNDQLLGSDLRDSMQHGTGLDDISKLFGHLSGPPVLVQIMGITDIGVSAFQLEQIRAAREERTLAGIGDEENEEDGDIEVEGEGPMPKYPRGTLHFQMSDGATVFEAMEYRPIPQLGLGSTKLGYKLQLKGTRFSNGMAFLEPATVKLIGGSSVDLDVEQPELFKMGLFERLGAPFQPVQNQNRQEQVPNNVPLTSRAPLRDISPPPPTLHDDDVDMEPRRRLPATSSFNEHRIQTPNNSRPIKALPSYYPRKSAEFAELNSSARQPKSMDRTGQKEESPYPNANASGSVSTQSTVSSAFLSTQPLRIHEKRNSFDFDLLNQVDNEENMPPPTQSTYKGKERSLENKNLNEDSFDYGIDENDFADANFLATLDQVEKDALEGKTFSDTQLSKLDVVKRESSRSLSLEHAPSSFAVENEVIEIDDDSEEDPDKENAFVPMRHVRRRTEDYKEFPRGRSPATSPKWAASQVLSQRKATARVAPDNVIAISDSD